MKILLFGGAGQLGFEVLSRARDLSHEIVSPPAKEVDISNASQVLGFTKLINPSLIINAAAYTAVDKAEEERDLAFKVNSDGARCIAEAAKAVGAKMIHVSTDYVFDGELGRALNEQDPTSPINVYGASKLAGEIEINKVLKGEELILRTSSLHGQRGENFVHTMLRLFDERDVVSIVNDQFMSPTWAGWLAEVILDLWRAGSTGVVHCSCGGTTTWYEFASAIYNFAESKRPEGWKAELKAIPMTELPRPAKRPRYSAFDTTKLERLLQRHLIPWQDGLKRHLIDIGRLKSGGEG